jgi:Cof subfamily protein (haloacid dehalogenase superfamily)
LPFRLIALDLDGTLLNPQHRISPANAAAVAACVAGGARVLIATGRSFTSARPYVAELSLAGPQITLNGAVFGDIDGDQMITRRLMDRHLLAEVTAMLEERRFAYMVFGTSTIYTPLGLPYPNILESYGEPPAVELSRAELLGLSDAIKVLTFLAPGPLDAEFAELMGDRFEVMRTGPQFFEFLPPGISKGSALAELMVRYEVPRDEVLVIGDGENDMSMFGVAGLSVAMGNAPEAVKARAAEITTTCAADGVALALRRYVL